jgi:putative salt-induced outer membrane protein YdiY
MQALFDQPNPDLCRNLQPSQCQFVVVSWHENDNETVHPGRAGRRLLGLQRRGSYHAPNSRFNGKSTFMTAIRLLLAIGILVLLGNVARASDAPWSEEFTPPPGEYSWIQLDTGEWLKGEIIALYDDILVFDSDHFGDLRIDLEDIDQVLGRGIFALTFRNGAPVGGQISIRGQSIVVEKSGEQTEFRRVDLVSITPAAERERDRWAGDVSIGLNARRGNSEISEVDISASLQRRTPVSRIMLDYLGNTNETDGEQITDSHRINLAVDRFTGRRLYWRPISAQYFKDELQNISHQGTVDTGLGFHLMDTQRVEWDLSAGVGGNYLENVSVAPGDPNGEWSPVGTFGSDLDVELTSWMDFELEIGMSFLEEAAGKYQHHIVSTLSTDLINDLDLDISVIWDRTEVPQIAEDGSEPEPDDYRLVISLTYDF